MTIPNETILTRPLGSSTAASEPAHYVRLNEFSGGIAASPKVIAAGVGQTLVDQQYTTVGFAQSVNIGSCWSDSTDTFTASVAGHYMVNVGVGIELGTGTLTDAFFQITYGDGSIFVYRLPSETTAGAVTRTVAFSQVVYVAASETIKIQYYADAIPASGTNAIKSTDGQTATGPATFLSIYRVA